MQKKNSAIVKRSIATYSAKERKENRTKVMREAASSREAATKFLQKAGILGRDGKIARQYK